MIHTVKMYMRGRKNQRSFTVIACDKQKKSSRNQIILGYLNNTSLFIKWDILWNKINQGTKINKNLFKRLTQYLNNKGDILDEITKQNINKLSVKHTI